ncbi:IPExxxVDY family protein [Galbibacter sp.]|jgi:Mg2+/Co2+ transporter CorC|uniref:IPExxxVDY family protein n=1 Tax=Galbibacter sp. TaxID=2918471 RepID=UPI003A8ED146
MAVYKLLDEDFEHAYTLIAIHASLEDYRVAYLMNSVFNLRLKRMDSQDVVSYNSSVTAFEWFDEINQVFWGLLKNKTMVETEISSSGLFENNEAMRTEYVVPEYSRADYLLKIDDQQGGYNATEEVVRELKKITGIITTYTIDVQELKSKNNLIFLTNA